MFSRLQSRIETTESPVVFAGLFPLWIVLVVADYGVELVRRRIGLP